MGRVPREDGKKQQRKSLLLKEKVKIIQDLEKGDSVIEIMKRYKISAASTIYGIKYAKDKIINKFTEQNGKICKSGEDILVLAIIHALF